MAQTPTGLDVPAGGDPFDPQVDLVKLAASLGARIIVPVPNVTARGQLVTRLTAEGAAPSATAPLYVHRGDAPAGFELESTTDGTTFQPIASPLKREPGRSFVAQAFSVTTNGSGDASFTISGGGFPNGLGAVWFQDSASIGYGLVHYRWLASSSSKTSVSFRALGNGGTPAANLAVVGLALMIGY